MPKLSALNEKWVTELAMSETEKDALETEIRSQPKAAPAPVPSFDVGHAGQSHAAPPPAVSPFAVNHNALGAQIAGMTPRPSAPVPQQQQAQPTAPAGIPMAEHSQITTAYSTPDPKAQAIREQAQAGLEASIMAGAEVGAHQAAAESEIRQQAFRDAQQFDAETAQREAANETAMAAAMADRQRALDEFGAYKKDPNRYYKNLSTAGTIAAGIAVALSAAGQAVTAGATGQQTRSTAFDIINQGVERDLDSQESEYRVKGQLVNAKENTLAMLRQRGMDMRVARSTLRQHMLESAAMRIEAKAAAGGEARVMANAKLEVDKLRAAAASEADNAARRTVQIVKSKQPAYTPEQMHKMSESELARFVPSFGGLAATPADATALKKFDAEHGVVVGDIQRLKDLVDQHGNEALPTIAKAKMSQLFKRITVALNKEGGLGAMSGSDRELIEGQIADPTSFWGRGTKTSELLGSLLETMHGARVNTFKGYGLGK